MMNKFFQEILSILKTYIRQVRDGELSLVAASLSFSTILSLVPFLAVALATFHWMGGSQAIYPQVENLLLFYLREAAGSEIIKIFKVSIRNIHAGTIGITGGLILIITSLRLLHIMEYAIHRVWNIEIKRALYKRLLIYWVLIISLPFIVAFYLAFLSLEEVKIVASIFPSWLTKPIILISILFSIYKFVPGVPVRKTFALISSIISGLGLLVLQGTYSYLTKKVFMYGKIYGSFAAFPLFLIWILCVWYVILAGAAICASLEKNHDYKKNLSSHKN